MLHCATKCSILVSQSALCHQNAILYQYNALLYHHTTELWHQMRHYLIIYCDITILNFCVITISVPDVSFNVQCFITIVHRMPHSAELICQMLHFVVIMAHYNITVLNSITTKYSVPSQCSIVS